MMRGLHTQNTTHNNVSPNFVKKEQFLLYAAVQSRPLLSLNGNRAAANRSHPLK